MTVFTRIFMIYYKRNMDSGRYEYYAFEKYTNFFPDFYASIPGFIGLFRNVNTE